MLPLFDSLLGLSWALWIVISFVVLTGGIALLFLVHRRNNKKNFIELEQKIYDHADVVHKQLEYKMFRLQKLIEELPVSVHVPASLQTSEPEFSRETKEQTDFRSVPGFEAIEYELADLKQQLKHLSHQNEVFKQGIYMLINEMGNRLNASDSHLNRFINLLDELASEHGMDLLTDIESEPDVKPQYTAPSLSFPDPEIIPDQSDASSVEADTEETESTGSIHEAKEEEERMLKSASDETEDNPAPDMENIDINELVPEVIETAEAEAVEDRETLNADFAELEEQVAMPINIASTENMDLPEQAINIQSEEEDVPHNDESANNIELLSAEDEPETRIMVEMETVESSPESGTEELFLPGQPEPAEAEVEPENEDAVQPKIEEVKADGLLSLSEIGKMYLTAPDRGGFFTNQNMSAEPSDRSIFVAVIDPASEGMASLSLLASNAELVAEIIANADTWLRPVCDIQSLKGTGTRITQLQKGVLQYADGKWYIRDDARVKLLMF